MAIIEAWGNAQARCDHCNKSLSEWCQSKKLAIEAAARHGTVRRTFDGNLIIYCPECEREHAGPWLDSMSMPIEGVEAAGEGA